MESVDISIAATPAAYGCDNILTGVALTLSHTTIMDSSPASAVAIHRLSRLTHTVVIGLHYLYTNDMS
jgi:hypothetical protein